MDERVFSRLDVNSPDVDSSVRSRSRSLLVQMLLLNQILFKVNSLNTGSVTSEFRQSQLLERVNELSTTLEEWRSGLPRDMLYTPENLRYWAGEGCGSIFIILHVNYNHLGQLLFHRFLHLSLGNDELFANYAKHCKTHADNLCEIIYRAIEQPDTDVRYPLVGHMLVVASTVQLHSLLYSSDDTDVQVAKSRLETNFKIISSLQAYWPSLQASTSRFDAFHRACLQGKDSFRFDQWMLHFLVEFARPVEERDQGSDRQAIRDASEEET